MTAPDAVEADKPALRALSAYMEDLRGQTPVAQVHAAIRGLSENRMLALGFSKVQAEAVSRVRINAYQFTPLWTNMRRQRKVPPSDTMILPAAVVLAPKGEEYATGMAALRLWRTAKEEEKPRPPIPTYAIGLLIGTGVLAIAAGLLAVNAGLDRYGLAGYAVAAAGALIAAIGGDVLRRALQRRRR